MQNLLDRMIQAVTASFASAGKAAAAGENELLTKLKLMKNLFSLALIAVVAVVLVGCEKSTDDKVKDAGAAVMKDAKTAVTNAVTK